MLSNSKRGQTPMLISHTMKEPLYSLLMFSSTGLLKLQSLLRASNQTIDMSVIVRQADLSNMRAVLKEAKHNYWTHIIAELNITETELLLKMVSSAKPVLSGHLKKIKQRS